MTGPSTSPTAPDWDAIARYLAGDSSASEAIAVRQWLDAHPTDAKAIAALDAAIGRHVPRPQVDVEAALRKVKTRATRRTQNWTFAIAGLAAAAAVVALLVVPRSTEDRPTTVAESSYTTRPGMRDTITLSDGTRITLGPSSRVAVSGRDITLDGEAFFTMASEKTGAYAVKAKGVTIRDIGTAFGVRAYANEPLKVVVSSGIVEITAPSATVVLDSGDVGVVGPTGVVSHTADAVTADDVAWMQGRLVFRNASMATMRADLQRWYGVELRVTDTALQRRHFTGSFSGEPVDRVGDVIALALGARAERRGDTLVIRARR
jgi:transmembrane sensor